LTTAVDDGTVVVSRGRKGWQVMNAARYPFILRERLGEDAYTALVGMVEEKRDDMLTIFTERFERRLAEECSKLRVEMNGLRTEMAHYHADLLKWSLVAWVSQTAAVAAIVAVLR
jgi:hypothetical protein